MIEIGIALLIAGVSYALQYIFGRISSDLEEFIEDSEFDSVKEMVGFAHK